MADENAPDPKSAGNGHDQGSEPMVPRTVLEAQRADGKSHIQALERQVAELQGQNSQQSNEKQMTRTELQAQVEDGKLSESQRDEILDAQSEARITKTVTDAVRGEVQVATVGNRVADEINRYVKADPDILKDGSTVRGRLAESFDYLVGLGDSDKAETTQLKALHAAFGPINAFEKTIIAGARETHEETGGGGDGGESPDRSDGWPKDMPKANRSYYQDQIKAGFMGSQKEAVELWNYKPKHSPRARAI